MPQSCCSRCPLIATFAVLSLVHSVGQAAGTTSQLGGTVVGPDGKGAAGALVCIVSAAPHVGASLDRAWCYPECGKHTVTDPSGQFTIRGVYPGWLYTVLVEAKDCRTQTLVLNPRLDARALIRLWAPNDPNSRVAGRVLHPGGKPAVGAVVIVEDYKLDGAQTGDYAIDRLVKTDEQGRFTITCQQALSQVTVTLRNVGAAKQKRFDLKPGTVENTLQLMEGAIVTGRVARKAKGVEGVVVGLTGFAPRGGNFSEAHESITDGEGRFIMHGVQSGADFHLFTRMGSPASENLAAITRDIQAPGDLQTLDIGELNLHPAHRVRGRVVFADSSLDIPNSVRVGPRFLPLPPRLAVKRNAVPPGIQAVVERPALLDFQKTSVDERGEFAFEGVPSESIVLSFQVPRGGAVPGYQISPQCYSLDYYWRSALCGRVDDDVEIIVLFAPGETSRYSRGKMRQPRRINGDPLSLQQRRIEFEPLRGVPSELLLRLEGGGQ